MMSTLYEWLVHGTLRALPIPMNGVTTMVLNTDELRYAIRDGCDPDHVAPGMVILVAGGLVAVYDNAVVAYGDAESGWVGTGCFPGWYDEVEDDADLGDVAYNAEPAGDHATACTVIDAVYAAAGVAP